jgi:hypothetical protein
MDQVQQKIRIRPMPYYVCVHARGDSVEVGAMDSARLTSALTPSKDSHGGPGMWRAERMSQDVSPVSQVKIVLASTRSSPIGTDPNARSPGSDPAPFGRPAERGRGGAAHRRGPRGDMGAGSGASPKLASTAFLGASAS